MTATNIPSVVADGGWRLNRFIEPKPLPGKRAASERRHAGFLCIRARR
nr:hypothetical protein [Burkholderia lata]